VCSKEFVDYYTHQRNEAGNGIQLTGFFVTFANTPTLHIEKEYTGNQ
jgi:hypothetical protein